MAARLESCEPKRQLTQSEAGSLLSSKIQHCPIVCPCSWAQWTPVCDRFLSPEHYDVRPGSGVAVGDRSPSHTISTMR
jgi:hypothetical protein